jgi:hypothetical protein
MQIISVASGGIGLSELLYGQFINTSGLPGRNMSADLFMEHLKRELKKMADNQGSRTESASNRYIRD